MVMIGTVMGMMRSVAVVTSRLPDASEHGPVCGETPAEVCLENRKPSTGSLLLSPLGLFFNNLNVRIDRVNNSVVFLFLPWLDACLGFALSW